jgi:hypothetical protein
MLDFPGGSTEDGTRDIVKFGTLRRIGGINY